MKIKTSELIGPALDWAVAKCETLTGQARGFEVRNGKPFILDGMWQEAHHSDDWSQAGPIIDREQMEFLQMRNPDYVRARTLFGLWTDGPTMLVAALRAYIRHKLGDEVEIPEELA